MEGPAGPTGQDIVKGGKPGYTDYDATNGTTSLGDVYRFGGDYRNGRYMLNGGTVGAETSYGNGTW